MTLRHAARHEDGTDHGDRLPQGGAEQHVLIEGKSAWRTEVDLHDCRAQRHGEERCLLGSLTVLIGGHMAVREGDQLTGAGLPNRVTTSARHVCIGDAPRGLRHPALASEFCADMCAIKRRWASMTPAERKKALEDAVNKQLKKFGMPKVTITDDQASGGTLAPFVKESWTIQVPPGTFTSGAMGGGTFNEFANTLYHEARHGEQWYAAARHVAGAAPGADAAALYLEMDIPLNVGQAAVKNPAAQGSYADVLGEMMYNSVLGPGRDSRTAILNAVNQRNDAYNNARYRGLPEEEDAWRVGDLLDQCTCR